MLKLLLILSPLLLSCGSNQAEEGSARPLSFPSWRTSRVFTQGGARYAPADFDEMQLSYVFDVASAQASGTARIRFHARENGKVFFLSRPDIDSLLLDGAPITAARMTDPDGLSSLVVPAHDFHKMEAHELVIRFRLPGSAAGFHSGGVSFLTAMSDFPGGNYLEAYAPIGFEDDSLRATLDIELRGASNEHRLYVNGEISQPAANRWHVEFPDYFRSSSFFVHFSDTTFEERRLTVHGLKKDIPVIVYSKSGGDADAAVARLPGLFAELEDTYGPYPHAGFVAYIYGRGGMEHSGATITSVSALGHELTHSWFARGVMPADGRSGWIDEAIASWRDNGYFRATRVGSRAPTSLAWLSAFDRFTVPNCYADGRAFLAELDLVFSARGGLRPFLRAFFEKWKYKSIHNDDLEADLADYAGPSEAAEVASLYHRYVYGNGPLLHDPTLSGLSREETHPRPFTEKEIRDMR